jgi:predicted nucleic acid-binding protein
VLLIFGGQVDWLIVSCSMEAGLYVPTIVLGELYAGAYHVIAPAPLLQKITDLLNDVQVLDFDRACAEQFGQLRGSLLQQGVSVPTVDLMIAAVALVHNLTLVTNNTSDFQRIPGSRTGLRHELRMER